MQSRFNLKAALTAAIASTAVIGAALLFTASTAHAARVLPPKPTPTCQWVSIGGMPVLRCPG